MLASLAVAAGRPAFGQAGEPGATFLLFPTNARAVAIGGSVVADPVGSSVFLANPAAFARLTRREASFDFGQDALTSRYVAGVVLPSRVLGALAVNAYLSNNGSQPVTDANEVVIGTAVFRDVAYSASYAARFGSRFNAGITYKFVQNRIDCSGACASATDAAGIARRASTSAVDVGAQYDVGRLRAFHIGAAVQNLGLRLQIRDHAQADPLPTQLVVGAAYDVPNVARYVPDASLRVLTETSAGIGVAHVAATYHIGAEGTYRRVFTLRGGYAVRGDGYGGPAFGLGLASKRLSLDITRQITTAGPLVDKPPTYVGLRYGF